MQQAGFNTFQLHNGDIFLDMLTDSGVNAMSDRQQAAMLQADDAYAGSETFFRMQAKLQLTKDVRFQSLPKKWGLLTVRSGAFSRNIRTTGEMIRELYIIWVIYQAGRVLIQKMHSSNFMS